MGNKTPETRIASAESRMPAKTNGSRAVSNMALTGAGIGVGTILGAVLQDQPQIIGAMVNWGPGLAVLGVFGYFFAKFVPPLIENQGHQAVAMERQAIAMDHQATGQDRQSAALETQARALEGLTGAMRESLNKDTDVRMAMNTVAGEMREMAKDLRQHLDWAAKERGAPTGNL